MIDPTDPYMPTSRNSWTPGSRRNGPPLPFDTFLPLCLSQCELRGSSKHSLIPRANLGLIQRP